MKTQLKALHDSALAAHVGPLVAFMLLSAVPDWFRIANSALPWYVQQPEHWWYPIQVMLCGALLFWWRRHYQISPCRHAHLLLASGCAFVGIALWVLPGALYTAGDAPHGPNWWRWLGFTDRSQGFDPTLLDDHPIGQSLSLAFRFLRSTLIVPLVEELCWRGWLMRAVIAGDRPFTRIPFGTHSWKAYAITTLAVTLIHQPEDWAAAFIWGSLVYLVAVKTRSLRACILMHAIGNLLLGLYILRTQQFGYW